LGKSWQIVGAFIQSSDASHEQRTQDRNVHADGFPPARPVNVRSEMKRIENLVPGEGLEPPTFGLQNRCTTAVLTRLGVAFL
jgi:hypothetical protein